MKMMLMILGHYLAYYKKIKLNLLTRRLIDELHQKEILMDDFQPDIVILFLTLLEEKVVKHIKDAHFRELHKISHVFKVDWLVLDCRNWLELKIEELGEDADYASLWFIFEEALFMSQKLNDDEPMNQLIARRWHRQNSTFIIKYMEKYDTLKAHQLNFLLRLAGRDSQTILQILIDETGDKKQLDKNTRYLLQNINFELCASQNGDLCRTLLENITRMSYISRDDLKMVLALSTQAVGKVPCNSDSLHDERWGCTFENCDTFENLLETIRSGNSEGRITFMQAVIDLSAKYLKLNPPTDDEALNQVKILENICKKLSLRKVSKTYIASVITIIQASKEEGKEQAIKLLELIGENPMLSADEGVEILAGEKLVYSNSRDATIETTSDTLKSFASISTSTETTNNSNECYFKFMFSKPRHFACSKLGTSCGFIVKFWMCGAELRYDLCREEDRYQEAGLHIDNDVFAHDMYLFGMNPGHISCKINRTWCWKCFSIPFKWGWWYWCEYLFDHTDDIHTDEIFVQYDNSVPAQPQLFCDKHRA